MKTLLISLGLVLILYAQTQAASQSHTFVLVHGAWHGNWTYYKLKYELEKAGHIAICVNLPSHGLDTTLPGNVTLPDYQNAVVNVLDSISEKVVLVGHSMGGIAISMAAEARPDKIDKLVYLAAFMPKNGESMLQLAMQDQRSLIGPSLLIDTIENTVDLIRENISDIFYDASTAEYVLLSKMLLKKNPLLPLATPLTLTDNNYGSVRRFYITTKNDRAITPEFQDLMISESPCEDVYKLNTEHSPFFSAPNKLKNILDKIGDDDKVKKDESESSIVKEVSYEAPLLNVVSEFNDGALIITIKDRFEKGAVSFIDTDGTVLRKIVLEPQVKQFSIPVGNFKEAITIAIINIDGICYNRKFYVSDF